MEKKFQGIIVSHTHWDRAWYWPFQQFRIRLIQTVDKLIEILKNNKRYESFTLDGQTVVLEDYLEVKPENEKELKNLIKNKKLLVGPWYILPDEFLVSGESLVRNLMLGMKIAKSFGNTMKEGYIPDPFGHIQMMPQILNGFGIKSFIFSRGSSEENKKLGTEFIWRAPDGSEVLAILQRNSYGHLASWGFPTIWLNYENLKPDMELALKRIKDEFVTLSKIANTNAILFNNGCDHLPPQPELPDMIEYVNPKLKNLKVKHGTFSDYIELVRSGKPELQVYEGELIGNAYNIVLIGVYSTRTYLKQRNHFSQNLFEKYTEPVSAFSFLEGGYDYSTHIWTGWKLILKNHPHDDICGSSVDEVHQEMVSRFNQADQVGQFILNNSIQNLAKNINTNITLGQPILVYNPNNFTVSDQLEFDILFNPEDPVMKSFSIFDSEGNYIPFKIIESKPILIMELFKEAKYQKIKVLITCNDIPQIGYKTFYISEKKKGIIQTSLKYSKDTIENDNFQIICESNGTLSIFDKRNGNEYKNCNVFEDTEDIGDEYTYSYSRFSKTYLSDTVKANIEIIDNRPVSLTLKVSFDLKIPKEIEKNRQKRSQELINLPIVSLITLFESSKRIDIKTSIDNKALDHRLRVLFPTGINLEKCLADGHFGLVERDSYYPNKPTFKNRFEYYGTRHHNKFIDVSDTKKGFIIANKGLPEYEIIKQNKQSVIALTLFRSVGWLSRGDMICRATNAGPAIETPEAQCLGINTYNYSIIPILESTQGEKYLQAYQFNNNLQGYNIRKAEGILKDKLSFIEISNPNLVISAIKIAENKKGIIVRFYNVANKEILSYIKLYKKFKNAFLTNLNEEVEKKIKIRKNDEIEIISGPNKIISILVEF